MEEYRRGDLIFDVIDRGPTDGPPVVLLHGFPQFNTSWDKVMDRLVAAGYRCVAPNQRGYSPRARPRRRRDYVTDELVGDVLALLDAIGAPKVHLVGHDWGAVAAWATAATAPERLATLSALSVPHPAAFFKSFLTSRQILASWYMYFFQLPKLPEKWFMRGGRQGMRRQLEGMGQPPEAARRDADPLLEPGVLTGGLNWYRAMPLGNPRQLWTHITVPTLYVWSDGDPALVEKGARDTVRYVDTEYRFELLHGVSHWMADECPDTVADLLLEWFAAHPL